MPSNTTHAGEEKKTQKSLQACVADRFDQEKWMNGERKASCPPKLVFLDVFLSLDQFKATQEAFPSIFRCSTQ